MTTKEEEEESCPICLVEMTTFPYSTLGCSHTFHQSCLKSWCESHSDCPLCRTEIDTKSFLADELEEEKKQKLALCRSGGRPRCLGLTKRRISCKNYARFNGKGFCRFHENQHKVKQEGDSFSFEDIEEQKRLWQQLESGREDIEEQKHLWEQIQRSRSSRNPPLPPLSTTPKASMPAALAEVLVAPKGRNQQRRRHNRRESCVIF